MAAHRLPLLFVAALLAGCAAETRVPPPPDAYAAVEIPGFGAMRSWGDDLSDLDRAKARAVLRRQITAKWERAGRPASGVRSDILALSGGGPDGAFGAGLLTGWSRTGERPTFDIVTGISVGALIAPFAFAGEEYDPALRAIFTELGEGDVAEFQPIALLFGALGAADTAPLRGHIRALVDPPLLERIAEAHAQGRFLLIGTTNIDAARPVLWNMGEIARRGEETLFEDVMLASASIPGIFPPVAIDVQTEGGRFTELHVDGGVTHSVMIGPRGTERAIPTAFPFPVRRTIYVIQNNALFREYSPVAESASAIASRSFSTLIQAQVAADLGQIYESATAAEAEFRLAFVPPNFAAKTTVNFDRVYMRRLFAAAEAAASDGVDWLDFPPGRLRYSRAEQEIAPLRARFEALAPDLAIEGDAP